MVAHDDADLPLDVFVPNVVARGLRLDDVVGAASRTDHRTETVQKFIAAAALKQA